MFSGAPFPERVASVNAYLGALPIAAALDAGADIVLTGRCVDSALALGPLIHEFGWRHDDYDRLSAGSLAGHIIECGAQATGGIFTDWRRGRSGWDRHGFPDRRMPAPTARFVITKPEGTGGLVTPATVAEQIVYEVGDPARLSAARRRLRLVATCTLDAGRREPRPRHRRARPCRRPPTYKVSATYADGFRAAVDDDDRRTRGGRRRRERSARRSSRGRAG